MTFREKLACHFVAERWGLAQYLLAGLIDLRTGLYAPYQMVMQGYGDDEMQIRFLIGYLQDSGLPLDAMQLMEWETSFVYNNRPPMPGRFPCLQWQDNDTSLSFCPSPLALFTKDAPAPQLKPHGQCDLQSFVNMMDNSCQHIGIPSGTGEMAEACLYRPLYRRPISLVWDQERQAIITGDVVGTPGRNPCYLRFIDLHLEASRFWWDGPTIMVENLFHFVVTIRFRSLYGFQLQTCRWKPRRLLKHLLGQGSEGVKAKLESWSDDADLVTGLLTDHSPLMAAMIRDILVFPDQQQRWLYRTVVAGNTLLQLLE